MTRRAPNGRLRGWVVSRCARLLNQPLGNYIQRVPNHMGVLKKTLRKGDILLVEGDQRVSQVIRYLTQSSWSHSALYVGDDLLRRDPARGAELTRQFGAEAKHLLIEALFGEGVVASPLCKYERYNIRICRPERLRREDLEKVIGHVAAHLGDVYDVRHIWDLARYFFPVSVVPRRWRRAALHFGSGSEREVICSSMLARAFASVGFPISPRVTLVEGTVPRPWWRTLVGHNGHRPLARFCDQDPALITPREFDLSPYFAVIKFNHLADPRFSYRNILWEEPVEPGESATAPPGKGRAAASNES